jgi:hypothetical protein
MSRLFAVIRSRGPSWDASSPLEGQRDWRAHAEFMDGLEVAGFALLVGPLEGTQDALLVVRATDEAEVRSRLREDPWREDMLRTTLVAPWTLRIGSLN